MKTMLRAVALAVLGLLFVSAYADEIKVMSQNQYFGADFRPLLAAESAVEFNNALAETLQTIAASLPRERIKGLAEIIAKEQPVLVGMQEMYLVQCTDLGSPMPGTGCGHPSVAGAFTDHLQETLDALEGTYVAVAVTFGLDVAGLPFVIDGVPALLTATDRDVILARADVEAVAVDFTAFSGLGICPVPSGDGCAYAFAPVVNTPYGPVSINRGYSAVDLSFDGRDYRLVNTHLEVREVDASNPLSPVFQAAQSAELLQVLQYTTPAGRTLLVVGDFNSSPVDPAVPGPLPLPPPFNAGIMTPYQQFLLAGFTDVWTLRPGRLDDFTCCQLSDLSNQQSVLYERVDLVFSFASPAEVKKARVLGAKVADKTPPAGLGIWPSDHGSVSVTIRY
jgi:hypothetical protein